MSEGDKQMTEVRSNASLIVEDALGLQEQALVLARKLGATGLPAPFTGDLR